jgi:hypothetical protein
MGEECEHEVGQPVQDLDQKVIHRRCCCAISAIRRRQSVLSKRQARASAGSTPLSIAPVSSSLKVNRYRQRRDEDAQSAPPQALLFLAQGRDGEAEPLLKRALLIAERLREFLSMGFVAGWIILFLGGLSFGIRNLLSMRPSLHLPHTH